MKLFTSIAPKGVKKQFYATESWVDHGFKPHSLNTGEEIEFLQPKFPHVKFIQVKENAMEVIGKPFIFVDDLFQACAANEDPISGIVNSDIIFRSSVHLPKLIAQHAANGIVYGSRIDVSDKSGLSGDLFDIGFDFFFMDRVTAGMYPKTHLCMGAPMWDYWAPLVPILQGRSCKFLNAVVALHVVHDQAWDNTINIRMMYEIIQHSGIEFEGVEGVDFMSHNNQSGRVLGEFADFIIDFLSSHSEPVFSVLSNKVQSAKIDFG